MGSSSDSGNGMRHAESGCVIVSQDQLHHSRLPGEGRRRDNLAALEARSAGELNLERQDYRRYLGVFKDCKARDHRKRIELKQIRLNKSFDEEIMREGFDDVGDDLSRFKSNPGQDSVMTFPLCKDDDRRDLEDPRELANLEVFREKLKSIFTFNNCKFEVREAQQPDQPVFGCPTR